ncbi:MAG: ABC transporter permease [Phycisphaerales bacterium]|nr:ABC transporter permease [Phycisphaerales bacterium]
MRRLPFEYAVRNLGRSPMRLVASVLGGALVALLALSAGGFVRGMEKSLAVSAGEANVMLLGAGSEESVERSEIRPNVDTLVAGSVPGIRESLGVPYVSPEVHVAMVVRTSPEDDRDSQAILRGVTPTAFLVHPQVQIIEGAAPKQGAYQVMVGQLTATRMGIAPSELAIGRTLWFDNHQWTITGHFAAPQTVMDAEIWMPLTDLRIATRRETISCVVLSLDTATLDDVRIWAAQRLDLELVAVREADYYAGLLAFYKPVRMMVWIAAALIALGGLFGGLNTMYAAFATRIREIGALQTLGFPRRAIIVSFLQESTLAMTAGAVVASMLGLWLLNGLAVRFSMGAFAITIDAPVLLLGLLSGVALGAIGVIPPLWRCLRLPIAQAIRMS